MPNARELQSSGQGEEGFLSAEKTGKQEKTRRESAGVPKRYILLLMTFIGFVNIYAMRVNLNVALVAMVNNQTIIRQGVKSIKVMLPLFCHVSF